MWTDERLSASEIPRETIEKMREMFVEIAMVRGGKTAEVWTDEQVVAQFFRTLKAITEFARVFNLAMGKVAVQITRHMEQMTVPDHMVPYLTGGVHADAIRERTTE